MNSDNNPALPAATCSPSRWLVMMVDGVAELWQVRECMNDIKNPEDRGWVEKINGPPWRNPQIVFGKWLHATPSAAIQERIEMLKTEIQTRQAEIAKWDLENNERRHAGPATDSKPDGQPGVA